MNKEQLFSTESISPAELPYYLVKDQFGFRKMRMGLEYTPQKVEITSFSRQLAGIEKVYQFFNLLWQRQQNQELNFLRGLPLALEKMPLIPNKENQLFWAPPLSMVCRVDVVGGKIVDINNKPAGLGLISTAEEIWQAKQVWDKDQQIIGADLGQLLIFPFSRAAIITEEKYPFASDQVKLAQLGQRATAKPWEVVFSDRINPLEVKPDQAIFCFSYHFAGKSISEWRGFIQKNFANFLVNPLTAVSWDNKALMALPFLEARVDNNLATTLEKLQDVFPRTYLFFWDQEGRLRIFKKITQNGLVSEPLGKENVPLLGPTYFKPLGESGGRGVIRRTIADWGSALSAIERYANANPQGFIIQQETKPESVGNLMVKDGYFYSSTASGIKFITIERMGTVDDAVKIHGGSETVLAPVFLG